MSIMLSGCQPIVPDLPGTASTGDASSTTDAGATPTPDPASVGTTASPTTDPTAADPTSITDATTEPGPSGCEPDQDDDDCELCAKEKCCTEVVTCESDPDCSCMMVCFHAMSWTAEQECLDACMVEALPLNAELARICVATGGCLHACQ